MVFHADRLIQLDPNLSLIKPLSSPEWGGNVCQCHVRREGGRGGRASQSADKIESHKFRRDKIKSVREAGEAGSGR